MRKMKEDKLENVRELLERKRSDVAGSCWEKDEHKAHEYSDFEFDRKESFWVSVVGFFLRKTIKRYKCRKCYKAIKRSDLKTLKEIQQIEYFIRRNTR